LSRASRLGGKRLWAAAPDDFAATAGVTAVWLRNSDRLAGYTMVAAVRVRTMPDAG
jgi:hypothetical protein